MPTSQLLGREAYASSASHNSMPRMSCRKTWSAWSRSDHIKVGSLHTCRSKRATAAPLPMTGGLKVEGHCPLRVAVGEHSVQHGGRFLEMNDRSVSLSLGGYGGKHLGEHVGRSAEVGSVDQEASSAAGRKVSRWKGNGLHRCSLLRTKLNVCVGGLKG